MDHVEERGTVSFCQHVHVCKSNQSRFCPLRSPSFDLVDRFRKGADGDSDVESIERSATLNELKIRGRSAYVVVFRGDLQERLVWMREQHGNWLQQLSLRSIFSLAMFLAIIGPVAKVELKFNMLRHR